MIVIIGVFDDSYYRTVLMIVIIGVFDYGGY
jgi:hypothetical protein